MRMELLHYRTKGFTDIIDITYDVEQVVKEQEKDAGVVVIFVKGSTAAITTIEYEPGLVEDFKQMLNSLAPYKKDYKHHQRWGDDNGASHLRASLLGPSLAIPFKNKKIMTGTWQQIVLIDFDTQEREREVVVVVM